eukprot:366450-Chlamydomonas_euryale.AAC.24
MPGCSSSGGCATGLVASATGVPPPLCITSVPCSRSGTPAGSPRGGPPNGCCGADASSRARPYNGGGGGGKPTGEPTAAVREPRVARGFEYAVTGAPSVPVMTVPPPGCAEG